jgi:hypothetical protein
VNIGNQNIQFNNFNLSNTSILSFSGSSGTNTLLNPGEALGIDVDLHPSTTGAINETLSFQTNVPGSTTVQIPIIAQSSAVGIEEINSKPFTIYPNPVINEFKVSGMKFKIGDKIKIADATGSEMYAEEIQNETLNFKLETSAFPKGAYFFTVINNNRVVARHRFVKF